VESGTMRNDARRIAWALAVVLALLLVAPVFRAAESAGLAMTKPETVGMSSERLQRITRFIKE
jgi:hypothetical protein